MKRHCGDNIEQSMSVGIVCVCVVLGVCEGDMCSVFIFNAQVEVNAVA